MLKFLYGLTTIKEEEEDSFEGRNNGDEDQDIEEDKENDNIFMQEIRKKTNDMATFGEN